MVERQPGPARVGQVAAPVHAVAEQDDIDRIGAAIYYLVQDSTAKISPYFWEFIVGGMLIATVLFLEGGLMDLGRVGRNFINRFRKPSDRP